MKENFCGLIVLPKQPRYDMARQVFNRAVQKFPLSIAYCRDEEDVICALRKVHQNGHSLRVRSGGHHYEGFSIGDCVPVIDVSCMDQLSIEGQTVTAGPGALNQALYETLGTYGYPFPSGTCPSVAVAGLTQGGGWGLSARMFGLTCDRLLSATLIDACGKRHFANALSEQDLFFALRGGGGGNFGVVTSLTYQLPPPLFDVIYVDLAASHVTSDMAAQFIRELQQWLVTSADHCFTPLARIQHTQDDPRGLVLRGIYYGSEMQARASLDPFLQLGLQGTFAPMTFLQAMRIVESGYPEYERFTTGGRFVLVPFTACEALEVVSLIDQPAQGAISSTISFYGLGGAVAEKRCDETAFFYRNAINIIALTTNFEKPDAKCANRAWFAPRYRYLESVTCGAYINFPTLENTNYMEAYYGGNVGRLIRTKTAVDPENAFCFPQSICVHP